MASNEGHIHWDGSPDSEITYLNQSLTILSEISNMSTVTVDPRGTLRIKATGFGSQGLALPSSDWQPVPGTAPTLEVRMDGHYPKGYIRIRQA